MSRLILASASPTRLRVLREAGFDPECRPSGVSEETDLTDPAATVAELARRKARAAVDLLAAEQTPAGAADDRMLVIACDTMLSFGGRLLGKPASVAEATDWCRAFSGSRALLLTGHHLIEAGSGRSATEVVTTDVFFSVLRDDEIDAYVGTGEPLAMAGSFSIDGYGAPFVERIEGDHTNVLGISLPALRRLCGSLGVEITSLWRRPSG
ncbi:MAG TPA: nucleoside triphosphate pyrophosphatase [Acidimicrobiales bacterium]|nr:nucleoside triphosphate pyrophosphatase [Acidimicrobiales bacterium]